MWHFGGEAGVHQIIRINKDKDRTGELKQVDSFLPVYAKQHSTTITFLL